jgi:hypothetical protein
LNTVKTGNKRHPIFLRTANRHIRESSNVTNMETVMDDASKHWRTLCIAAAFEEDPHKLSQIIADLNTELPGRQQELADQIFARLAEQPIAPSGKFWVH